MEKKYLFAPGPVLTTENVKKAALIPDLCHRSGDFEKLYAVLRKKILKIVKASEKKYLSVVITGSGSAANESVISSIFDNSSKALVISNGEFGNRLKGITDCYGIETILLDFGWGGYPDASEIEDVLNNDPLITHILMVMHETSSGIINPVKEVGKLAEKYDCLYHLDTVSAVGAEKIELDDWGVDFCTGVPNKAVGGQPGVSFVVVKKSRIQEINNKPVRNLYLRLQKHIELAENLNQTPNTPSVVMFSTFLESVNELLSEGVEERVSRYKENRNLIREGVEKLNLGILQDEEISSSCVTSVFLPEFINMEIFLNDMENAGYIFYNGKGPFIEKNMFQIANMGEIYKEDTIKMLSALKDILEKNNSQNTC